ncbi:MAG: DUF58 domain-containing protein [Acetobacter papayae]
MPPSAAAAAALAARMPDLLLRARQTAATLAAGLHPQRRAGWGDSFWQYRPAQPGEPASRIDWRQSARTHHAQVREKEAETAQTVLLWCDMSPSMDWCSASSIPSKLDSAITLLLTMAALLLRAGETVQLAGPSGLFPLPAGGPPLERLAMGLMAQAHKELAATPDSAAQAPFQRLPVHLPVRAHLLIASDFLGPQEDIQSFLRHLAALPVRAHLLAVRDPAEASLPYAGRVLFTGLEGEQPVELSETTDIRAAYASLIATREGWLADTATRYGHDLTRHQTDQTALTALLSLHTLMSHSA